ncbi:hypothetical protein ACVDG5_014690 [Mesorhizobium sp. ORM6]
MQQGDVEGLAHRAAERQRDGVLLLVEARVENLQAGRVVLPDQPAKQRLVVDQRIDLAGTQRVEALLDRGEVLMADMGRDPDRTPSRNSAPRRP